MLSNKSCTRDQRTVSGHKDESCFSAAPEDFEVLLDHLGEMGRAHVMEIGDR
jgi:hypothetical protein